MVNNIEVNNIEDERLTLEKAQEHLDVIENKLFSISNSSIEKRRVKVFRLLHNIKGSWFDEFDMSYQPTHQLEEVLKF